MTTRFYLRPDVLLVEGRTNGAIYDLRDGRLLSVSPNARQLLAQTEKGTPLSQTSYPLHVVHAFLEHIHDQRLGDFSLNPHPPPKVAIHAPKVQLRMLWLTLTNKCNLKCVHCYAPQEDHAYSRSSAISIARYVSIIGEAQRDFSLHCLQLIGGEPLLIGFRNVEALLETAATANVPHREVFTNGLLIDDEYVSLFRRFDVSVALSLYSDEPDEHDAVTGMRGSWHVTTRAAQRLLHAGVPIRFGVVATARNRDTVCRVQDWVRRNFGVILEKAFDVVRPCGRGATPDTVPWDLFLEQHVRTRPDFMPVSIDSLARSMYGNTCWSDTLCILPNGDVTPCPMEAGRILGNVHDESLHSVIFGSRGTETRQLSKDKVADCRECEFRYACWECRAMSESLDTLSCRKPLTCLYDLHAGVWREPPLPVDLAQSFPGLSVSNQSVDNSPE